MPRGRVRVVHLVTTLNVGGLEMVVYHLVHHCDRTRFEPFILCLEGAGTLAPRFEALGVPVEIVSGSKSSKVGRLFHLTGRLTAIRPDVLHTHNPTPHYFGSAAALLARVPVLVHTKHGRNYPDVPRKVLLNRLAAFLTDRVVAVSANAAEVTLRIERVPGRQVCVIRNGIDLAGYPPVAPRGEPSRRVIHVARLQEIKGQHTLLRAARMAADVLHDFRLDIVGDGPARDELHALHADLRLGDRVRFLGERPEIAELLTWADLFVLPSLTEGLSLTLLEAMAAGLPIVATDVGGNAEVVVDGQTGLLVPPQAPADLAAAMIRLLCDPDLSRRMGRAGRARVEKEFDVQRVVARYEALYEELLERKW